MALKVIKLMGEQKKILFLPQKNPIAIKGVAGSGKTTVALYRAKHLVDTYKDLFIESNVIVFTFNKSLAKYMKSILPSIPGGYQKDSDIILESDPGLNIKITNFHKWAHDFLSRKHLLRPTLDSSQIHSIIDKIRNYYSTERIAKKSVKFFMDEISWINGHALKDEQEYFVIKRTGRGVTDRVTRNDRPTIWKIYEDYTKEKRKIKYIDFDDYALLCLKSITDDDREFSHIIIDEAQDLTKAQLLVLSKLVKKETNSITIIADAAQQIYNSGFSWSDVGLNIRGGRSISLQKNYRNTFEIANAAYSLLNYDKDKIEPTIPNSNNYNHGNIPSVLYFSDKLQHDLNLISTIKTIQEESKDSSVVVLHWSNKGVKELCKLFEQSNIDYLEIKEKDGEFSNNANKINICTMASIKGLEFDVVIITGINNEFPSLLEVDEDDKEDEISRQRRVLYVSMTRAKQELYIYSYDQPSIYLNEIDKNLINYQKFYVQPAPINDLPF